MQPARPRLLLLDGTSVVRRVYEGVPGEDGPERVTGAITAGFYSILRALGEHKPTHFLAAFDDGGPTWRHELFPQFKAGRPPMNEQLRAALPQLYARLQEKGLMRVSPAGYEADDVLATIATRAAARGFEVIVAANDIDYCFLLTYGVRVYNHFGKVWCDEPWLDRKMGIKPHQIPDALALIGDARKGLAGVQGVGPVKAAALLAEHGDLEGVLAAAPRMKGVVAARIVEGAEACRLGRQLLALKLDVNLGLRPCDLEMRFR